MVEYDLEPHHMRLLTLAAEAFDAAQEAREVLVGEGKVYVDRFGQPKPRPEVSIQRDSAISFVGVGTTRARPRRGGPTRAQLASGPRKQQALIFQSKDAHPSAASWF